MYKEIKMINTEDEKLEGSTLFWIYHCLKVFFFIFVAIRFHAVGFFNKIK